MPGLPGAVQPVVLPDDGRLQLAALPRLRALSRHSEEFSNAPNRPAEMIPADSTFQGNALWT